MVRRQSPTPPHPDDLGTALSHYNDVFRHRYSLPALHEKWLSAQPDVESLWNSTSQVRLERGIADAACAVLARVALSITPRYGLGFVDSRGHVSALAPRAAVQSSYYGHHVLLVNPIGGDDNWNEVATWFRQYGGDLARRQMLAGLASERRPDYDVIDRLLRTEPGRAVVLPPDEGFSAERAAEVSFIYDVSVESLRTWKRKQRAPKASGKPGRPRNR